MWPCVCGDVCVFYDVISTKRSAYSITTATDYDGVQVTTHLPSTRLVPRLFFNLLTVATHLQDMSTFVLYFS